MPVTNIPEIAAVAALLRKNGQDAGALLMEMGMMQLIVDFRKRARAENIGRTDQIDAIAKMFASVILAFGSGIKPLSSRTVIVTSILSLVEAHMLDTAKLILTEDFDG